MCDICSVFSFFPRWRLSVGLLNGLLTYLLTYLLTRGSYDIKKCNAVTETSNYVTCYSFGFYCVFHIRKLAKIVDSFLSYDSTIYSTYYRSADVKARAAVATIHFRSAEFTVLVL